MRPAARPFPWSSEARQRPRSRSTPLESPILIPSNALSDNVSYTLSSRALSKVQTYVLSENQDQTQVRLTFRSRGCSGPPGRPRCQQSSKDKTVKILHPVSIPVAIVGLALVSACSGMRTGERDTGSNYTRIQPNGEAQFSALSELPPPLWVPLVDVSARVEVTELLAPRYETTDGLRPLNPIGTDVLRRYQIALATVRQHYLPSDSTLLAFVVNYTVDGRDHATIRHRLKDIAIGDTGVVYGQLATGGRGVGYLVDYYGPTPPFPNGPRFADYALREAVLSLRQTGQQYEALEAGNWCEIENASCVNHRTGWSATTSQFEQYMTEQLALQRVATPERSFFGP